MDCKPLPNNNLQPQTRNQRVSALGAKNAESHTHRTRTASSRIRTSRISIGLLWVLIFFFTSIGVVAQDEPDKKLDDKVWDRLIYLPYKNLQDVVNKHGSTVFMPYEDYLKLWKRDTAKPEKNVKAVITASHYVGRVDKSLLRIEAELTVTVLGDPWVEVPIQFGKAAVGKLTAEPGKKVLLKGVGNGQYALLFGQAGEHTVKLELAAPIQTSPDGRNAEFVVPPVGVTTFELAIPQADQTVDLKPQLISLPANQAAGETRIKANLGSTTSISAQWHPKTGLKPEMNLLASVTNYQKVTLRDGVAHTDAWLAYTVLRGEMNQVSVAVPKDHRILGVSSGNAKIKGWVATPGEKLQTVVVDFLSPVKDSVTLEVHTEREFKAEPTKLAGIDDDGNYQGIHSVDSVRESGQIAVVVGRDLSMQFEEVEGLARIEAGEVVAQLKQANAATFKFYSSDVRLVVLAQPVEPRILVDSRYTYEFHDDELRLAAQLNYRVERAGVFELLIKMPTALNVSGVEIPSNQVAVREFHVEGKDDKRVLRVLLNNKTKANEAFTLMIKAEQKFADASETLNLVLPIPQPITKQLDLVNKPDDKNNVEREIVQLFIFAPDALEVTTDKKLLKVALPLPVSADAVGEQRMKSAWTFNRRPVTIPVRTSRKPTRLTASVATNIQVKEEIVNVEATLTYNVRFAGIDRFRFSVPAAISEQLQITSLEPASAPAIKDKIASLVDEKGWVTWTVTTQRDVVGTHRFFLKWDIKTKTAEKKVAAGDGQAAGKAADEKAARKADVDKSKSAKGPRTIETVVQTVRVLGIEKSDDDPLQVELAGISGEIVVGKDRSLAITATRLDDGLEAIDIRELTMLPQSGSLAYRYFRQPVGVKIKATKYEIQKVVETVVTRALVEVVARDDLKASYRCRYLLKSSERQRLRVDVPSSAILGVFVNNKSVQPEKNTAEVAKGWSSYFINVARTANSDETFSLMIQLSVDVAAEGELPFSGTGGSSVFRFPQIGGLGASGVATQQMRLAVWVPEDCNLVGDPAGFTNESSFKLEAALSLKRVEPHLMNLDDWVGVQSAGFIDFPTEGAEYQFSNLGGQSQIELAWLSESAFTWLISGVLVVLAIMLRKFAWDHKLLMLFVAGIIATLFGISSPGWAAEIVSAARFGIYGLLGIWILTTVGSWRSSSTLTAADAFRDDQAVGATANTAATPAVIPPPGVFDDFRTDWS